jgi:ankyrin repeat protein
MEISQHIGQNHMDMCRFAGLNDVEYKKVAAALHRMTRIVSKQSKRAEILSLSEEQRQTLVDSMRFDQIDARQMTIKRAHAKTCEWLLKKSEYLDWLDAAKLHEHYGFLWIKGKPGTGKSTMMKFALNNSRKTMKDRIIVSFFFNARGADLERTTIGMYRSLLVQLLERLPELQCVFEYLGFTWNNSRHYEWSVELLNDLFEQAIQLLGQSSVVCFIDALDECNERQVRDLVAFFQHLGELTVLAGIRFQVCFSSRHYPHITISKGLSLVLEGQEGHIQDITSYIDSSLRIGHSKLAEQIRIELQEKASGVFMWVVLVVDILNKEHDSGRMHELRQRLQDIPGDLHELFRDILTRDCYHKNELLLCIQWLLFARRPLKPEELYFAILSGIKPQTPSRWDSDEIATDTIKRFILNSSKGLAEITKSKTPSVQFIHESVRDFLLKENGLRAVWSDLGSNFQGQSHERLKQGCLNYVIIDIATHLYIGTPLPRASSPEAAVLRQSAAKAFPFLQYAVQNVLYHADTAERDGVSQKDFVPSFPLVDWINLDNLFERHEIRRHTLNASLLYILAEGNMPNLIRVHPSNLSCFEVEDERYGLPIFAALATRSDEAVQVLLETQVEIQPLTSPLHDLCKQYCQDRNKRANFGRNFTFPRQKGVLSCVADLGDEVLLAFLLNSANVDADSKDQQGRTPLSRAAEKGYESVVRLLLITERVDADSKDQQGRTPLSWAIEEGHEGVAKLLLTTERINADLKDQQGRTPLSRAAEKGYESVVRLLLITERVDADSKDQQGQTPLSRAAEKGHEGVVKLLFATKRVDADSKDQQGRTPLWYAAANGREAVVQLLLEHKADADSKDQQGRTPLSRAAEKGYESIIKLLLITERINADLKDQQGRTPLSRAAEKGHEGIVKLLFATKRVDANTEDNDSRTPLCYAAANGREAVVQLLLEHKANADAKDRHVRTPLLYAAANGCEAVVQLLLEHKTDADAKDIDGRTPLSWAAAKGREAVVRLLLATEGVDANSQDNSSRTPLLWTVVNTEWSNATGTRAPLGAPSYNALRDYQMQLMLLEQENKRRLMMARQEQDMQLLLLHAAGKGHKAIVELLLENGANADSKDDKGLTPLLWAADKGHKGIVELLLENGANADSKDDKGLTPLLRAAQNGHEAIVQLLKSIK